MVASIQGSTLYEQKELLLSTDSDEFGFCLFRTHPLMVY